MSKATNVLVTPTFWVPVGLLIVVGGVVPIIVAWHFGALGIPRNDDWSYARSAFELAESGRVNGRVAAVNLVGQLVLALPVVWTVGNKVTALQLEVAALGVVGLIALWDLGKQVTSSRRALLVALLAAVGPLWASLSASFMTDVPAFALGMVCLAIGARAIRRAQISVGLVCLSLSVGFVAFTIRDTMIVAPTAVAAVALWTSIGRGRDRLREVVGALIIIGIAAVVFELWRGSLPGFVEWPPKTPTVASVKKGLHQAAQSIVLVGLLVSPAVALAGPARIVRVAWARGWRITVLAGTAMLAGLGAEMVRQRDTADFLGPGDYVSPLGTLATGTLPVSRTYLLPKSVFATLGILGVCSAALLVLAAMPPTVDAIDRLRAGRFRAPKSPALAVVALSAAGFWVTYAVPPMIKLPLYDRYLLPVVPLIALLVIHTAREGTTARGWVVTSSAAFVLVALLGTVYALNAASFNAVQWRVAEKASRTAGGDQEVDAGYVWNEWVAAANLYDATSPHERDAFCIAVRMQSNQPERRSNVLYASPVWSSARDETWIVARQVRPCSAGR